LNLYRNQKEVNSAKTNPNGQNTDSARITEGVRPDPEDLVFEISVNSLNSSGMVFFISEQRKI
jgi:hypothetical protein